MREANVWDLGKGWTLEEQVGEDQYLVVAPQEKDTATLDFALAEEATSGPHEIPIPAKVMDTLWWAVRTNDELAEWR